MVGEIGVRELGPDDVFVFGEFEERVGREGDVVGDGRVVVSMDSCLERHTRVERWGRERGRVRRTS